MPPILLLGGQGRPPVDPDRGWYVLVFCLLAAALLALTLALNQ